MRKLNNPMPNGGAPFTNEDLNDVFQTEIWAALQATLSAYNSDAEGVIVSGCVVSANASNFDMTAGIVYLNGEFMRVDAVTNLSFPRYIKAATPTNVTRTFENSTTQTFIIEKKAEVSATVDGSGQEITISTVTNSINRRLERIPRLLATDWTDIPYGTNGQGSGSISFPRAQYCKDKYGFVHLRGGVRTVSSSITDMLELPLGARPEIQCTFSVNRYDDDIVGPLVDDLLRVETSGDVGLRGATASNHVVWLDGVNFYAGI